MTRIAEWLQQPTTVTGIAAILGTAVALLMHQVTFVQAVPLFAGAVASAILPDNSGAKQQAQLLAGTMVAKFTNENATGAGAVRQTDGEVRPSN